MNFAEALRVEATRDLKTRTENGAVAYKTTGRKLLDLNFAASSYRSRSDDEVYKAFMAAYREDPRSAMLWLFYLRDIRGGMGERRFFRVVMERLAADAAFADLVCAVIPLIPEYGRWDDMLNLLDGCCDKVAAKIIDFVAGQLKSDSVNAAEGKPISLLAKWMPGDNATNRQRVRRAMRLADGLGMEIGGYRKTVTGLRKYLKLVERSMSTGKWSEIAYDQVPSRANLIYKDAFLRHDRERRTAYLSSVSKGGAKINAETLFPHDIVHRYSCGKDESCEALWNALPDYSGGSGTLVVRDGSCSMCQCIGNTKVTALDVSTALAVYFAERSEGPFKDQFITFSARPCLVSLGGMTTLRDKLHATYCHGDCTNTNIEAVFNLILDAAVRSGAEQQDLPERVLVISDMEFDRAMSRPNSTLFEVIRNKFAARGYQLPKLVFWNVCSRSNAIPIRENENGVALVSGFSPAAIKMVLREETDPYEAMTAILNSERYAPVQSALNGIRF